MTPLKTSESPSAFAVGASDSHSASLISASITPAIASVPNSIHNLGCTG